MNELRAFQYYSTFLHASIECLFKGDYSNLSVIFIFDFAMYKHFLPRLVVYKHFLQEFLWITDVIVDSWINYRNNQNVINIINYIIFFYESILHLAGFLLIYTKIIFLKKYYAGALRILYSEQWIEILHEMWRRRSGWALIGLLLAWTHQDGVDFCHWKSVFQLRPNFQQIFTTPVPLIEGFLNTYDTGILNTCNFLS